MARSRRGGGSSFRRPAPAVRPVSRPKSTEAKPAAQPQPAPAPQSSVPAPQQVSSGGGGGGMLSGIGSTIAQGMAFGTGSAIAHRAVGAVAGSFGGGGGGNEQQAQAAPEYAQGAMPAQQQQQQQQFQGACAMDKQMYYECLQTNKGDQEVCQFLYDQLMQCQQNQTQFG